ncbi:hypothetical protein [Bradyrhizobium sp. USDA 4503]
MSKITAFSMAASTASTPGSPSKFSAARKRSVASLVRSFSAILKVSRPSTVTPWPTLRMVEGASEPMRSVVRTGESLFFLS